MAENDLTEHKIPADKYHAAVVVSTADPMMLGRIQARVGGEYFEGIEDAHLPWARSSYEHPAGASDISGKFEVPVVGSKVLVKFQSGSLMHPIYYGYFIDMTTSLPESQHNYPMRKVSLLPSGTLVIFDEMTKELFVRNMGDINLYVLGNVNMQVDGNVSQRIKGNREVYIDGNDTETILGTKKTFVTGSTLLKTEASLDLVASQSIKIVAGDTVQASAGSDMELVSGGSTNVSGGSKLELTSSGSTELSGSSTSVHSGGALALGASGGIDFLAPTSPTALAPATPANSESAPDVFEAPDWPAIRGPLPD